MDVAIAAEGHHAMLRFCDAWPEQRFELAGFNVLRVEEVVAAGIDVDDDLGRVFLILSLPLGSVMRICVSDWNDATSMITIMSVKMQSMSGVMSIWGFGRLRRTMRMIPPTHPSLAASRSRAPFRGMRRCERDAASGRGLTYTFRGRRSPLRRRCGVRRRRKCQHGRRPRASTR